MIDSEHETNQLEKIFFLPLFFIQNDVSFLPEVTEHSWEIELDDSEFKQSNRLFEKEYDKWRTWICLDVSKNTLNAEDEARTKAFHHNHRVALTVVKHTLKDHSLYTSFACTVFNHEIHILWATSHLEGIKGFMDETMRTKETRHVQGFLKSCI